MSILFYNIDHGTPTHTRDQNLDSDQHSITWWVLILRGRNLVMNFYCLSLQTLFQIYVGELEFVLCSIYVVEIMSDLAYVLFYQCYYFQIFLWLNCYDESILRLIFHILFLCMIFVLSYVMLMLKDLFRIF